MKNNRKQFRERLIIWFLVIIFSCQNIAWASPNHKISINIENDTLAPESFFKRGNLQLSILIKEKVRALASYGHHPWLAEQLAIKQIEIAEKSCLIVKHALDHEIVLIKLIEALAKLERVAEFFNLSFEDLLTAMGFKLKEKDIFFRYKAFVEMGQAVGSVEIPQGGITESNYKLNLSENIRNFNNKRPDLAQKVNKLIAGKDSDYLTQEAIRWFNYFIYSTDYAPDFYAGLQKLASHLGLNIDELIALRKENLSDSEKNMVSKVRTKGRITYAEFMETALYDPEYGFYTRKRETPISGSRKAGKGEFITLPEKYEEFGKGIAYDLFGKWISMGRPEEFQIIEMGAGQGTMAYQILDTIYIMAETDNRDWRNFLQVVRYKIIEISQNLIRQQREKLDKFKAKVDWVEGSALDIPKLLSPNSITGVFISNELPDAFPVHKVKYQNGKLCEVYLKEQDGILMEELGEVSSMEISRFITENGIEMEEGETRVINIMAGNWLDRICMVLKTGYVMTFDYGLSARTSRAKLLTMSQFRKYGKGLRKQEMQYHGLSGEMPALDQFVLTISILGEKVGKDKTLETMVDILKEQDGMRRIVEGDFARIISERIGIDPFREMETVLLDYMANPLPNIGDVDITTDADFPALSLQAKRLGMDEVYFSTQADYFREVAFNTEERRKTVDKGLLDEPPSYKVQVLYKNGDSAMRQKKISNKHEALFAKGTIDTVDDVITLLDYLEETDFLGWSKAVKGVKDCASKSKRHLAGISPDCLIQINEELSHESRYSLNEDFYKRKGFLDISIKPGRNIYHFLHELVHSTPTDFLPEKYREYAQGIPELNSKSAFEHLYRNAYQRELKDEVLAYFGALDFMLNMEKMGYPQIDDGLDIKVHQDIYDSGMDGIDGRVDTREPVRTRNQLRAFQLAVSIAVYEGKSKSASINFADILIIKKTKDGIKYRINPDAVKDFIAKYWSEITNGNIASLLLKSGLSDLLDLGVSFLSGKPFPPEKFIEIKERLFSRFIALIGEHIDKTRHVEEKVVETDLGKRTLPVSSGQPERIKDEAENSRNLIRLISRYMEYVLHKRKVEPDEKTSEQFLNLIKLLDPERDIDFLRDYVDEVEKRSFIYSTDIGLIKTLYEAGFKGRAKELIKKLNFSKWTNELLEFLSSKGERELISRYLGYYRKRFELADRNSINLEGYKPISSALAKGFPEEAEGFFAEECEYIKNLLRIYMRSNSEKGIYTDDEVSSWWLKNRYSIDLKSLPFDIFNTDPSRNDELKRLKRIVIDFTEIGLKNPCLFEKALQFIAESKPSPTILRLYQTASCNIPYSWDSKRIEEFLKRWNKALHAVGRQLEKNQYFEPYGELQFWKKPFDTKPRKHDEDWRKMLPESYRQTRLFHRNISYMIDCVRGLMEKDKDRDALAKIAEDYLSQLGYTTKPFFNYLQTPIGSNYPEEDPFFYSYNSYAGIWARWANQYRIFDKEKYHKIARGLSPPVFKQYKSEYFNYQMNVGKEMRNSYLRSLEVYAKQANELYALGLKKGLFGKAEEIYGHVRHELTEAERTVIYLEKEHIEKCHKLEAYWALQKDVQKIKANGADCQDMFDELHRRIIEDTRGFFNTRLIAESARELSLRPEHAGFSVILFQEAIERLRRERGETNWFTYEVKRTIEDSMLPNEKKDEIYLYLLERLWPKGEHSIVGYFGMRDDVTAAGVFFKEILEKKKYPIATAYLIKRIADGIKDLDPKKYGQNIDMRYRGELYALSFAAGYFTDRRELLGPENWKAIMALYEDRETALAELKVIFPDEVKRERQKGKSTSLPHIDQIERGGFKPKKLVRDIQRLLKPDQAEEKRKEAISVLGAWFRHDILNILNDRLKDERKKKSENQEYVYIEEKDLSSCMSYPIVKDYLGQIIKKHGLTDVEETLLDSILNAKSREEAFAKAFLYYNLIRDHSVTGDVKSRAFINLSKTNLMPAYVRIVFERINKGNLEETNEFYETITLWDYKTKPEERPHTLWAHIFEEKDRDTRARLIERIKVYLLDKDNWTPNLLLKEDWWIMLHFFSTKHWGLPFNNIIAAITYEEQLASWSLIDRIIFILNPYHDDEKFAYRYFLENWGRISEIGAAEVVTAFNRQYPEVSIKRDSVGLSHNETLERDFNKYKELFMALKNSAETGAEMDAKYGHIYYYGNLAAVIELLKIFNNVPPDEMIDLRKILRKRFPSLVQGQIDRLYGLAQNPFKIIEAGDPQKYSDEKVWCGEITRIVDAALDKNEADNLIALLYPFSKSFYGAHAHFHNFVKKFPYKIPEKSLRYGDYLSKNQTSFLLNALAECTVEDIKGLLPAYARTDLARSHQMDISNITLPESLQVHVALALFYFKIYFNKLKIGEKEEIADKLKDLGEEESLHRFFILRDMVKLAQLLANRPEVPLKYRRLLKSTFDKVSSSDISDVENTIQKELGWKLGKEYKIKKILNAGSMGEVWLVERIPSGEQFAVKVLTATKKKKIDKILEEMEELAEILDWYRDIMDEAAISVEVLNQLMDLIRSETDFRNDKKYWEELFGFDKVRPDISSVKKDGTVRIPDTDLWTVMYYQSTQNALVMSYCKGVNVDSKKGIKDPGKRTKIAERLWDYLRGRIFQNPSGTYPIDLHLGNFLVIKSNAKIVLVDTGQLGRLEVPRERDLIISFLNALLNKNPEGCVQILEEMGEEREGKPYDREGLSAYARELLSGTNGTDLERIRKFYVESYRFGLFIRRPFMDLLKGMMVFEGTAKDLGYNLITAHEVKVSHPKDQEKINGYIKSIEGHYPRDIVNLMRNLLETGDISVDVSLDSGKIEIKILPEYVGEGRLSDEDTVKIEELLKEALIGKSLLHPAPDGIYRIDISTRQDFLGNIIFLPHETQNKIEISPLSFLSSGLLQYSLRHELDHAFDVKSSDEADSELTAVQNDRLFFRTLNLDEQLSLLWQLSNKNPNGVDVEIDRKDVYSQLEMVFAEKYGITYENDEDKVILWRFIKGFGEGYINLDKVIFSGEGAGLLTIRDYFYISPKDALRLWNKFYQPDSEGSGSFDILASDNGVEATGQIRDGIGETEEADLLRIDLGYIAERLKSGHLKSNELDRTSYRQILYSAVIGKLRKIISIAERKVIPILIDADRLRTDAKDRGKVVETIQNIIDSLDETQEVHIIVTHKTLNAEELKQMTDKLKDEELKIEARVNLHYEANIHGIQDNKAFADYIKQRIRTEERYRDIRLSETFLIATEENFRNIYQFVEVGLKLVGNIFSAIGKYELVVSIQEYEVLRQNLPADVLKNFEKEGNHYIFRADPLILYDLSYLNKFIEAQEKINIQA